MTARDVACYALLTLAVLVVLASAVGILVMPGAARKLHFVTPAALVAPVLVAVAVLVAGGLDYGTGMSFLTLAFLVFAGPFLAHATIRAIRVRQTTPGGGLSRSSAGAGHRRRSDAGGELSGRAAMTPDLMMALQVVVLVLVGGGAALVARARNRVRQVLALSLYGLMLAIMFLTVQAPDVTLSELVVGAIALPLILLLTIAKVRGPAGATGTTKHTPASGQAAGGQASSGKAGEPKQ